MVVNVGYGGLVSVRLADSPFSATSRTEYSMPGVRYKVPSTGTGLLASASVPLISPEAQQGDSHLVGSLGSVETSKCQ